jgi:hypothetical protein
VRLLYLIDQRELLLVNEVFIAANFQEIAKNIENEWPTPKVSHPFGRPTPKGGLSKVFCSHQKVLGSFSKPLFLKGL